MTLDGKVAIVTGAVGTGQGHCCRFGKTGGQLWWFRQERRLKIQNCREPFITPLKKLNLSGTMHFQCGCDVTDEHSVDDMVTKDDLGVWAYRYISQQCRRRFYYPVLETPLKRWDLVLRVGLTGTFLCSKAVPTANDQAGSGSIINISSGAANERDIGLFKTGAAYGVCKAGIERFTWGSRS